MTRIYSVTDTHTGVVTVVEDAANPAQALRAVTKDRFQIKPMTSKDVLAAFREGCPIVSAAQAQDEPVAAAVAPAAPAAPIASAEPSSSEPAVVVEQPTFPWTQRAAQAA